MGCEISRASESQKCIEVIWKVRYNYWESLLEAAGKEASAYCQTLDSGTAVWFSPWPWNSGPIPVYVWFVNHYRQVPQGVSWGTLWRYCVPGPLLLAIPLWMQWELRSHSKRVECFLSWSWTLPRLPSVFSLVLGFHGQALKAQPRRAVWFCWPLRSTTETEKGSQLWAKWQVLQAVGCCVGHANLSNVSRMSRGVAVFLKELCDWVDSKEHLAEWCLPAGFPVRCVSLNLRHQLWCSSVHSQWSDGERELQHFGKLANRFRSVGLDCTWAVTTQGV